MKSYITDYGFTWGPAEITRILHDDPKGWIVMELKTKKYLDGIQIYVTKTGKVRFLTKNSEFIEEKSCSVVKKKQRNQGKVRV